MSSLHSITTTQHLDSAPQHIDYYSILKTSVHTLRMVVMVLIVWNCVKWVLQSLHNCCHITFSLEMRFDQQIGQGLLWSLPHISTRTQHQDFISLILRSFVTNLKSFCAHLHNNCDTNNRLEMRLVFLTMFIMSSPHTYTHGVVSPYIEII